MNKDMMIREFDGGYNLELSKKKRNMIFSSYFDFSFLTGLDVESIKNIVLENNGVIMNVDLSNNGNSYKYNSDNTIDILHFKSKEDCEKVMNILSDEQQVSSMLKKVNDLAKKYNSKDYNREDIKNFYKDEYILNIWEIEKYTEDKGEGFFCFEDFLLDYLEQNLIFEQ